MSKLPIITILFVLKCKLHSPYQVLGTNKDIINQYLKAIKTCIGPSPLVLPE